MNLQNGGIRLFRMFGITVYLHWMWFLVAVYEVTTLKERYHSPLWAVLEYLAIFLIVLLHEFGHALACRSVGGTAERIILWPLGGVAFVSPPPRPGPMLWSIVAGPLVNVLLIPVTVALYYLARRGILPVQRDALTLFYAVAVINIVILCFNILPLYPLDGGKILWSLLWFLMGRWYSLMVATVIGLVGSIALIAGAAYLGNNWLVVMAAYQAVSSWKSFQQARQMVALNAGRKHQDFACPACQAHPPMAALWRCACGAAFDTFATRGHCPACNAEFAVTQCTSCGARHPLAQWYVPTTHLTVTPGVVPPPLPIARS